MAFRVVIDDVRHSLYNYHILFITRIILYIICDVFCALLHGLITKTMLRLYRVTLEMPEMDSTGQSAPIRVSLTSSRLKGASYWPSIT